MRVLLTGASSFTGSWFARELAAAGHEVVATFQAQPSAYADGLRRQRVLSVLQSCRGVFDCSFGSDTFVALAQSEDWDVLCHHAADVTNYRSPDFNVVAALDNNTRNLPAVLGALRARGTCRRIVLTGSVFENDEGAGSQGLPAFSPYGLSKGLTWQVFRYHALHADFALGKFVIPNPFGPYEEPRFTAYLIKTWASGKVAAVNTPTYVRDNIHVSLLAKAYADFVAKFSADATGVSRLNPSGYPESQGSFALRFAREMQRRLGLPCELDLRDQTDFQEPVTRINTDLLNARQLGWSEPAAWDELATYYKGMLVST